MKILNKINIRNYTLLILLLLFISSCNFITFKNISNNYRWKNKKIDKPININFEYSPELYSQVDSTSYFFLYKTNLKNIDKQYKIENLLIKKFKKRNIILNQNEKNNFTLKIDTLIFRGYSEQIDVYSNHLDNDYLGMDNKSFFYFKISGNLMKNDSIISNISAEKKHNTSPRESYLFSGTIVSDGVGANSEKMIENVINEFSYRGYLELNENMKKE